MKLSILLTVALICMYYITITHTDQISDSSRVGFEGRGRVCRSLGGKCRRKRVDCEPGYVDGPGRQPWCTNRGKRRCCYPAPPTTPPPTTPPPTTAPPTTAPPTTPPPTTPPPTTAPPTTAPPTTPPPTTPPPTTPPPTTPPPTTPPPTTPPPITTVGTQCPDGFCNIENQCFKIFNSSEVQYGVARVMCDAEGLILAEPATNAAFIKLAEYTLPIHASEPPHYFLGARGDGFGIKWQTGPGYVPDTAPWMHDQPEGTSSAFCLDLRTNVVPNTEPLAVFQCDQHHHFICEFVPRH